jgi:hypothetical protein
MKSLKEQIDEVLKANSSMSKKRESLISLGLKNTDIINLFRVYDVKSPRSQRLTAIQHTIGVEIECYNVDKHRFIYIAREKGIQIECESYNHNTKNHYKIVDDSSIIGENAIECVSPVLNGKKGLKSLQVVCEALNKADAKVNRSTGLHIHIGLTNIAFEQYKNIFINYIFLEGVIDSFMAKSRRGNDNAYCKSLTNATLYYVMNRTSFESMAELFNQDRYHKLNPVSFSRHNTLEFRQHQGTVDYTKITNWVNFIIKLVDWSKSNRLEREVHSINDIPFLNDREKRYFINRAAALQ